MSDACGANPAAASSRPPDLELARRQVLALAAGSGMSPRPPTVEAATPLHALAPITEARIAARADAGLLPLGDDYPRRSAWGRVVAPSAVLAAADAAGVVLAIVHGPLLLAVAAAVLFVAFTAAALFGARFAVRDPLRVSSAERRAVAAASRWQSVRAWSGPIAGSTERGIVIAAAAAAERIARSPAWRSGRIDEYRIHLDLAHELDQIDEQAHRVARARMRYGSTGPRTAPAVDQAWLAVVDRAAALTAFADQLDGYEQRRADALARQGDPVRDFDLLAGSAPDRLASDELLLLMSFLGVDVGATGL